jgi:hypothetical protein
MKLVPIKVTHGDASKKVEIMCVLTGNKVKWNEAVRMGWKVDLEGKPFSSRSYYSPERIVNL